MGRRLMGLSMPTLGVWLLIEIGKLFKAQSDWFSTSGLVGASCLCVRLATRFSDICSGTS